MSVEINKLDCFHFNVSSSGLVILPISTTEDDGSIYTSTSISFYKYARNKVDIDYYSDPEQLLEQRSGDWFGPSLFLSQAALMVYSNLASVACSLVSSYLYDKFKGSRVPEIKMSFVCEKCNDSTRVEVRYEGGVEGLEDFAKVLSDVMRGSSDDH